MTARRAPMATAPEHHAPRGAARARARGAARDRREHGAIAGLEGLVFGVLLFVFGTLVIVDAWGTVDAKLATSAAAREAARAYVEAPEGREHDAALAAARATMAGHGHPDAQVAVDADAGTDRCRPITIVVATEVHRIPVAALDHMGGSVTTRSSHTEVVDPYRSGRSGTAGCEVP